MVEIRRVRTPNEFKALFRFRYSIYIEEFKKTLSHADHNLKIYSDPLDFNGEYTLAAWEGDEVVGTVRSNILRLTNIGDNFKYYGIENMTSTCLTETSITTLLMVHPKYRCSTLAARLVCEIYRYGQEQQMVHDLIGCSTEYIPFFIKLGYLLQRSNIVHPEYGIVNVMSLRLANFDHFDEIRSPFRRYRR